MNQAYYEKLQEIRSWLLGKNYVTALHAMELGLEYHTGVRKDGKTPEFMHQVEQALFCRTLDAVLMYPEETFSVIFLHDLVEDCDISFLGVSSFFVEKKTAEESKNMIMIGIRRMCNQYDNGFTNGKKSIKKAKNIYYGNMTDPLSSLCKGFDRIHNQKSMVGVFSDEKQRSYVAETLEFIIPMLKKARNEWPQQEAAYSNVIQVLEMQVAQVTMQ